MADNDRFYQLSLTSRPLWWGDLGNRFQISGFVLQGEETTCIVLSPNAAQIDGDAKTIQPSVAEWWEIIKASDDPAIFVLDETGGIKAIHRKMRYAMSGAVQQKIWARDGFKCMYCHRRMGEVQLSIDHFIPWEQGGADDPSNYLSACRACNKRKGAKNPQAWCDEIGRSCENLVGYLKNPPRMP